MKKLIPILLLAGSTMFAGCGDSQNDYVFTNNGNLAAAPVARNDAYTTVRNTPLTIAALQGVLVNDTLNAVSAANVTVTFPNTTTQGGTVTLAANTGAFTYTPANGFVGTDTFSYVLANGFASSTATVTITVTAPVVTSGFFVDAATGNDATGSFATGAPFKTIQAAATAAGANSDVVVRPGNYTGAINLLNGQRLLGSGSTLVNAQGVQRPVLTGPIVLADGNTVDFVRIQGTAGDAIDGDGQTSGTVTNCEIANTTNLGSGVRIRSVNGTWTVEDNTINNVAGIGIDMDTETGDVTTAFISRNTITGSAFDAIGFISSDDSQLTVQANDNVMTGNQAGATFEVIAGDTSTACFQILGNQNDDVYTFATNTNTCEINVEQFSVLDTLNTGTVEVGAGSATNPLDVVAGFCGF